jgi:hypothetical protein
MIVPRGRVTVPGSSMHIALFFLVNLVVAGAIGVMAYVNGHGAGGIALRVIGTLVALQLAYAMWLFAIAWIAPPGARERRPAKGAAATGRAAPGKITARARDRFNRPGRLDARPRRDAGPGCSFSRHCSTGHGIPRSRGLLHAPAARRRYKLGQSPARHMAKCRKARPSDAQVPLARPGEPRQRRGAGPIPARRPSAPRMSRLISPGPVGSVRDRASSRPDGAACTAAETFLPTLRRGGRRTRAGRTAQGMPMAAPNRAASAC